MYCSPSPFPLPQWGRGLRRVGEASPSLTRSWVRGRAAQPASASHRRPLLEAGRAVVRGGAAADGDDAGNGGAPVAGGGEGADNRPLAHGQPPRPAAPPTAHPTPPSPAPPPPPRPQGQTP